MPSTFDDIREAETKLETARKAYLRRFGWKETCNTPGGYWLWQRDFAAEDAKRLEWWEQTVARKPPLGNPSKPVPYGIITASADVAIRMTGASLDDATDGECGSA